MSEDPSKHVEEKTKFYKLKKGLSLFGIVVSSQSKHPVHLTSLFFVWIAILIGLGIAANIGVYTYSTNPNFCNSCHIMKPYYNAWNTSRHKGKAVCVDCHYPPATNFAEHLWHKFQASAQVIKYVTRTYSSKPFAEIPDESCLRSGCHSTRLLEGKIVTARGIKFDHRPHLTETRRDRKLRCVSCHSQIVVGNHVEVTYSTCYLCHFKGKGKGMDLEPVGGCVGCHNLPTKSFQVANMSYNHEDFVVKRGIACQNCHLEAIQGDGNVDPSRCLSCHNQPEKLNRFPDTAFIHENHITKHHVACLHCHQEMRHSLKQDAPASPLQSAAETLPSPETRPETQPVKAHSPTLSFDCSFCHEGKHAGQLEMYAGKVESLGLPPIPSPMYLANVDCIGCHYREETKTTDIEFKGHTVAASSNSCIKCHGTNFGGIFKETKTELSETLAQLDKKLKETRSALETATLPDSNEKASLEKNLRKAEELHRFVSLSRGEHNIYLASAALRKEDAILSEVGGKTGAKLADLNNLPLISGGYCATMCHAKLGVKVPPETVKVAGKTMPHLMHTTMMGCVNCHKIGTHKEVPLKDNVKKEVCSGCHPE